MTGGWRKLCNEELHNLNSPPNIVRMKPRRMRRACSMHRRDEKCIQSFNWKNEGERREILKWILRA
jgi:hypothetical protein